MVGAWPLVGREKELRQIAGALRRDDTGAGVIISGPAGVGKTRLAREAVAAGARPSRWVAATESAQAIPLGALLRWVPGGVTDAASAAHAVTDRLIGDSAGHRVTIVVDDAHLLDEQSAFVLQQALVSDLVSIIATVRHGEPVPDTIETLWSSTGLAHIDVDHLERDQMEDLLEKRLGGPVNPVDLRRLWNATRGNQLYLCHLVDDAVGRGQLRPVDGVWALVEDSVVPTQLQALIVHRMRDLPLDTDHAIDLLAVGEPVSAATLTSVAGHDAVTDLLSRGLVTVETAADERMLRLIHPTYAETRRATLTQVRQRQLRGKLATVLNSAAESDIRIALRRAALVLDSDLPRDPAELLRAADIAIWLYDLALASRLAEAAFSAGGGWQARLSQAMCLITAGDNAQAEALLAAIAAQSIPDRTRAHIAMIRIWNLLTSGKVDEATAMLSVARHQYPHGPIAVALIVLHGLLAACGGRPLDALTAVDPVYSSPELPDFVRYLALQAKAIAEGDLGGSEELSGLDDVAARNGDSLNGGSMRLAFADIRAQSLRTVGRLADARTAVERAVDGVDTRVGLSWAELMIASTELAEGCAEEAARRFRNIGLSRPDLNDSMGWFYRARIDFVQACAISGDPDTAQKMLALIDAHPHRAFEFLAPQHLLAQAWFHATRGWISGAVKTARRAAEHARTRRQFGQEVLCLHAATRFGDPTTRLRLDALTGYVTGPRIAAAALHAHALSAGDGAGLDTAAEMFGKIGDRLSAADAAAQAAKAHTRAGRRGSAMTSAENSQRLVAGCGSVWTPALLARSMPDKLSARQMEVAAMAAGGMSNREIGERLHLSVRTVESHVLNACSILGTRHRAQLGHLMRVSQPGEDRTGS